MNEKLADRVALVTGGNTGTGLTSAKAPAEQDAKVYIVGRRQGELDTAVRFIGSAIRGIHADAAVSSDLDAIFAIIADGLGHLDVLFANAGGGDMSLLSATVETHIERIFATNARGVVLTAQKALLPLTDGVSVILTGSVAAVEGTTDFSTYSASKVAARSLARSQALKVNDRGIHINVVSPGLARTPGLGGPVAGADRQGLFDTPVASAPFGRSDEPEEIGRTVVFLAPDESSSINTAEICVDSGTAQV